MWICVYHSFLILKEDISVRTFSAEPHNGYRFSRSSVISENLYPKMSLSICCFWCPERVMAVVNVIVSVKVTATGDVRQSEFQWLSHQTVWNGHESKLRLYLWVCLVAVNLPSLLPDSALAHYRTAHIHPPHPQHQHAPERHWPVIPWPFFSLPLSSCWWQALSHCQDHPLPLCHDHGSQGVTTLSPILHYCLVTLSLVKMVTYIENCLLLHSSSYKDAKKELLLLIV